MNFYSMSHISDLYQMEKIEQRLFKVILVSRYCSKLMKTRMDIRLARSSRPEVFLQISQI